MLIYLTKNGMQAGPFFESEVGLRLATGDLSPSDLARRYGQLGWLPLKDLIPGWFDAPGKAETRPTRLPAQASG